MGHPWQTVNILLLFYAHNRVVWYTKEHQMRRIQPIADRYCMFMLSLFPRHSSLVLSSPRRQAPLQKHALEWMTDWRLVWMSSASRSVDLEFPANPQQRSSSALSEITSQDCMTYVVDYKLIFCFILLFFLKKKQFSERGTLLSLCLFLFVLFYLIVMSAVFSLRSVNCNTFTGKRWLKINWKNS